MSEIARERKKEKEFILERPVNGRYRKVRDGKPDRQAARETDRASSPGGRDRRRTGESERDRGGGGTQKQRYKKYSYTQTHTDRQKQKERDPSLYRNSLPWNRFLGLPRDGTDDTSVRAP